MTARARRSLRSVATVLLLLCVATPTRAQDRPLARAIAAAFDQRSDATLQRLEAERRAAEHADRDRLNVATAVFLGTAGADWSVTAVCFRVRCADDGGFKTSYFVADGFKNRNAALALGLALDTAIVFVTRDAIAPEHPKLARTLLYVLSGVRLVIVADKVGDLRRNARRGL